ncbi:DUF4174 domain-containing protein [Dokdonia ponticola]|uniref:DUF4174 domain-containing protein n=1 Tax=Dokdonia ponticola TaxID=2041041 RepID=A0ABV9HQP0_9FLAO
MTTHGQDLEKHQWENRILIVKIVDTESKKYKAQLEEFKNLAEEFIDRKLILYTINNNHYTVTNYKNSALNDTGNVSEKLAQSMLNDTEVFEVLLIGLDGHVKLQQTEILTKEALFKRIDSMPMRKNERKN